MDFSMKKKIEVLTKWSQQVRNNKKIKERYIVDQKSTYSKENIVLDNPYCHKVDI